MRCLFLPKLCSFRTQFHHDNSVILGINREKKNFLLNILKKLKIQDEKFNFSKDLSIVKMSLYKIKNNFYVLNMLTR